jgi:seryl-tRNA synthetase
MLDARTLLDDPELVRTHLRRRHADDALLASVDAVIELAERRVEIIRERDDLRARRNTLSREIGELFKAGRRDEADAAKAEVQAGNERTRVLEEELGQVEATQRDLLLRIPNLLHADVPDGRSDADNVEVRRWGTPREFDFEPHPHVEVGERLGILDFERAAKLTGSRFAVLRGAGARLERALINFFLDLHTREHGYTEVMVPYVVHDRIMEGTGQLPKFADDMFRLAGQLNGADAYLIPTAEVPVTNLHREEILDAAQLPLKYACFTPCFRAEAGAHGRDVRGLIRLHQFHKVELVHIVAADASEAAHAELLGHAEEGLRRLELPYRVEVLCSGDLTFSAHKCYDLEVWLPSLQRFVEISSVSNFGEFQARRMSLRYRPAGEDGKKAKPQLAHTLNGSGLAIGRTVVAILENYQQRDGSVVIPDALRPYMGGDAILVP